MTVPWHRYRRSIPQRWRSIVSITRHASVRVGYKWRNIAVDTPMPCSTDTTGKRYLFHTVRILDGIPQRGRQGLEHTCAVRAVHLTIRMIPTIRRAACLPLVMLGHGYFSALSTSMRDCPGMEPVGISKRPERESVRQCRLTALAAGSAWSRPRPPDAPARPPRRARARATRMPRRAASDAVRG